MVNTTKLNEAIAKAGLLKDVLAKELGITRQNFYYKMTNQVQFKASEILYLKERLNLCPEKVMEIFFDPNYVPQTLSEGVVNEYN